MAACLRIEAMGSGVTIYGFTKAGVAITNERLADLLKSKRGRPVGSRSAAKREAQQIDRLYGMGRARRLRNARWRDLMRAMVVR